MPIVAFTPKACGPPTGSPVRAVSRWRKGETIFEEGDPAKSGFTIESGWVRLVLLSEDGRHQVVGLLTAGDGFGFDVDSYATTAEAVNEVRLLRVIVGSAGGTEASRDGIQCALLQSSRRFQALAHQTWQILHETVEHRVLCFLAWLAHRQGPEPSSGMVRIPMSRFDIADYLGVAPGTLSRTITDLQQQGRIRLRGPRLFTVTAPPRFKGCRVASTICGACAQATTAVREGGESSHA